ncbi:septum site-determining protein MinC [Ideonella oryzae]|uniref:Probable septum site-determining protein MinC n=1 Tax=Ideonella oryzae TaxID=2937441 RepID=A0ABT1BIP8_9BURK|nr:septum site-determining protein MinC [Ideonella oryzae]MCO5975988.1 septum site-determining protein MinC [Ideonella oryzae]
MSLSSKVPATSVFELKSAALTVLALQLKTSDLASLAEALAARYGATPGLFEHEPLCVDLSLLRDEAELPDFEGLVALLRRHGFNPMAARGGNPEQMAAALSAGLAEAPDVSQPRPEAAPAVAEAPAPEPTAATPAQAELPLAEPAPAAQRTPVAEALEAAEPAAEAPSAPATVIIDKPLRSGQQVYARGADLIVLAVVSFGAEVIADGSIHVYAPLRGRAIAGAKGDTQARIFAACMEPQLVSIAGTWRTTEAGLPPEVAGKPAQVRLDGDKLLFEPLKF